MTDEIKQGGQLPHDNLAGLPTLTEITVTKRERKQLAVNPFAALTAGTSAGHSKGGSAVEGGEAKQGSTDGA